MEDPEIRAQLDAIAGDATLYDPLNFAHRLQAIEYLDSYIVERIESAQLRREAEQLRQRLRNSDHALFEKLRSEIRSGILRGARFRSCLEAFTSTHRTSGYDERDAFLSELLLDDAIPNPQHALEPEMVAYQPAPVRVVLALVDQARVNSKDTFVDIGSGLGQVPMLVNLLTGAATVGIELEPAFCEYARRRAADLNLSNVDSRNEDARVADYSDGTIFFFYTPVTGAMLNVVLERIHRQTFGRDIRLLTYGPCTEVTASLPWLTSTGVIVSDLESVGSFVTGAAK